MCSEQIYVKFPTYLFNICSALLSCLLFFSTATVDGVVAVFAFKLCFLLNGGDLSSAIVVFEVLLKSLSDLLAED